MTPREAVIAQEARCDRDDRIGRERQALVYSAAVLIGVAVHNPKQMPLFDKAFPDPRRKARAQTADEMLQAMRAWSETLAIAEGP